MGGQHVLRHWGYWGRRGAIVSKHLALVAFCLGVVLLGCTGNVQADSRIDPQLEAQVLQIIRDHPEVILESLQQYHSNPR